MSFRILLILIVPAFLLGFLFGPAWDTHAGSSARGENLAAAAETNPYLRLVQTTDQGVILELTPPAPQFETTQIDGRPCQSVSLPGLIQTDTAGLPALPVQGAMLGIPQDAQPTIQILAVDSDGLPGRHALCPNPQPVLSHSSDRPPQLTGYTYPYAPAYQIDAFSPAAAVELVSTGSLRSQRFAELRFNPLQYNPVTGELIYARRIQVALNFNVGQANSLSNYTVDEGSYEDTLQSLLLNYDQASAWRSRPAPQAQPPAAAPQSQAAYKILVNQDGLYQLSYTALQTAGVPVSSLDPRTFRLTNQGVEAAIYVEGEADGVFNTTDYLLFYGQKVNTKYTDTNVYWLSWGGASGLRMAALNGAPSGFAGVPADFLTTRHAELDTDYYSEEPSGANNDHWYWSMVYASSGPAAVDFTTDLQHLSSGSHTITVRGLLNGYSGTPNHHTKIYLNGNLIDDHSFPNGAVYSFTINNIPQSYLLEGTNTLQVECPRDGSITDDAVLVNWFEIDYYDTYFAEGDRLFFDGDSAGTFEFRVDGFSSVTLEAYDITNPLAPQRVTGAVIQATGNGQRLAFEAMQPEERRYLAQITSQRLSPLSISQDSPSSWKSTAVGADYIIISHPDFLSAVQPLADFRAGQGLRVQVVNVQDVYDEFNGGVFSPEAIKSFLAYAYASWTAPAPSFVLLVGDGNYDFKNFLNRNEPNYIPPYLDEVDPWIGEAPTDNRFVSVSGGDILPDLSIGRFPVRTAAETTTMVNKTLNYEQIAPSGGWNALQTFVADDADSGGNFSSLSDGIINTYVPGTYTVDKIYYKVNYSDITAARAALQNAINAGRLLVHFAGHASVKQWTSEGQLKLTDLPSLTNGSKLPFILAMTCSEGYFVWPSSSSRDYSALGESIVRIDGRGAIASWSPAGYGLSSGHDVLDRNLFDNLFNKHYTQLGYLTNHAKYYLYANSSGFNDLIETYLLFGDPALRLQTLPVALSAPSSLQASVVSSAQINLTWQDNSSDESEFRIERSLDGSTGWQQIGAVNPGVTSYSDTGRSCDTPYYYRVRAYRAADAVASTYSNTTNARTFACQTLSFSSGWNKITVPLAPINPYTAHSLLQAINGATSVCTEIDRWYHNTWSAHYYNDEATNNFTITMGVGYFVRCTGSRSWNAEGSKLTTGVSLNLVSGWNSIGVPYPSGHTAHSLLQGINGAGGACSEIDQWYHSAWSAHYYADPATNNFTLDPTKGYFVRCSQSSTYTP